MSAQSMPKQFSKLRSLFWPIAGYELKKLLPMLGIFFLLAFSYNILRCLKDTLVITADDAGVAIIAFIKVWVMFPISILLTYLFLRLSNRFSREKVFYIMISCFLGYFFLFAFVVYPARAYLHPHDSANTLQTLLPQGLQGFVAMYRYWTYTSFYTMCELWGPIILSVVFWGFTNQVTKVDEARRFYPLFGIGVTLSGIVAGVASLYVSEFAREHNGTGAWEKSLVMLISLVLVASLLAMILFRYLTVVVFKDPKMVAHATSVEKPEKKKFSLRENLRYLATSRYVFCLAAMITCYNVVINLVELLWKSQVNELVQREAIAYNIFMNKMTVITSVLGVFVAFFVSGNIIRKFGWTFAAMVTPIILLITSVGFFGFFFLKGYSEVVTCLLGYTPLTMVVFFGSLQNCLSRMARYTIFDATREMAFVPLTNDQKVKAKAAIDGVCNRLGKSGGAVVYETLLIFVTTIAATAPYVAGCILVIIGVWMFSVRMLGRDFYELSMHQETLERQLVPAAQSTAESRLDAARVPATA